MKQFLLLLVLACILSGLAISGPCLPGTLQDYIDLGVTGCTLGAVVVSDFALVPGQNFAIPINPSTIQVSPAGGFLSRLDLFFDAGAQAGDLLESFFRFSASGTGLYTTGVKLAGAGATGDGVVTSTMDTCAGGSFLGDQPFGCSGTADTAVTIKTSQFSFPYDSRTFAPTSFFDVFVDVTIDGGLTGSASLGRSSVLIGAVPEPSQVLLLLSGLASLVFARMCKFRK